MTWLISKIQAGDVAILRKLGAGPRLRDCIDVAYRKRKGADAGAVRATLPSGAGPLDWEARPVVGRGMELGGRSVLSEQGQGVFKGLNVFPGRLRGEPLGYWDGTKPPKTQRAYQYQSVFDNQRLFVSREIAQLPTIAPVPEGVVFNNTVNIFQLKDRFPLNGWVLSRPVMFVAATCLRSTIIEDLVCHWYFKSLGLLPMPLVPSEQLSAECSEATSTLIEMDDNLADRWRHVEALLADVKTKSVSQLIAEGADVVAGFALPLHEADETLPVDLELTEQGLAGRREGFELTVPNADLRAVIWYMLDRKRQVDEADVPVSFVASCQVPTDLAAVASAIRDAYSSSATDQFEAARARLDVIAARALGISDEELAYICGRFASDPFLSQIRPMWAHRGLHVQGYQDHSGGDRFAN